MPRRLPSVDTLLSSHAFAGLLERWGRMVVRDALRELQDSYRRQRETGQTPEDEPEYAREVDALLNREITMLGTPVFNMTGILLHSNLGRAALDPETTAETASRASGSLLLELDARTGKRGDRESGVVKSLQALTGAEAAGVVNNNAAAVMLVLAALCNRSHPEVIVSRGELVEIGGSFRLPDILRASGARLIEVGTTNSTRREDFEKAISAKTAAILKVHTSNYRIHGYTRSTSVEDLACIATEAGIPVCMDLGSGCLMDMARFGLPAQPLVQDALKQGASVVTFSADKLLGSVQAGVILGNRLYLDAINRHPMKRALRLDKLRLALLQETLKAYQDPSLLAARVPFVRHLSRDISELRATATRIARALEPLLDAKFSCQLIPHPAEAGSGSMPGVAIPSIAVQVNAPSQAALKRFDQSLRSLEQPIIGRIHEGSLLLDVRAVDDVQALLVNLASLRAS